MYWTKERKQFLRNAIMKRANYVDDTRDEDADYVMVSVLCVSLKDFRHWCDERGLEREPGFAAVFTMRKGRLHVWFYVNVGNVIAYYLSDDAVDDGPDLDAAQGFPGCYSRVTTLGARILMPPGFNLASLEIKPPRLASKISLKGKR